PRRSSDLRSLVLPAQPGRHSLALRLLCAALTYLALALLPGCGPGVGDLSGTVYYKNKVVTSGFVVVVGSDGLTKHSEIAENGSYAIVGVPAGEIKIAVS